MLTGTGLAASSGLNAWVPLLALGLIARYTNVLTLPQEWSWLTNGWVLGIFAALLLLEFIADKVPLLDSVNDIVYTVVRPTTGGIAFGAGSTTVTTTDPGELAEGGSWIPIAVGAALALIVHLLKALVRPALNALTAGVGAPFVSTAEDFTSVMMSLAAILLPVLVVFFLVGLGLFFWWALRRRARRRAARRQGRAGPVIGPG